MRTDLVVILLLNLLAAAVAVADGSLEYIEALRDFLLERLCLLFLLPFGCLVD